MDSGNLRGLRRGADAVAGWVELHPLDWGTIPTRLHEDDARECGYDALCDEIHARLDPDPADPFPRHTQNSGASLALTAAAYIRCGGLPAVASGEDRALVASLRRIDGRVRHAPEVHAVVSGRTVGRALGGMAETIRRRLERPDDFLDDRLEPAADCGRRAFLRAEARRAHAAPTTTRASALACDLDLSVCTVQAMLACRYFGEAWHRIEMVAPILRRRKVEVRDWARETEAAASILEGLRCLPPGDFPSHLRSTMMVQR